MKPDTVSIPAVMHILALSALCLSCGPREQPPVPAPTPAPSVSSPADTEVAYSGTTLLATATTDSIPQESSSDEKLYAPSKPTPSHTKRPISLPRLVDLGAGKCIPCKMMVPILDELKRDYSDQFAVEVIDVWEDPAPGRTYRIRVIPTQIFFDAEGKELWRHEGFLGKEDILNKWAELGVPIEPPKG